ncbi:MAG: RES family NAD+ phosphorylase [Chitinophagaceae bacterium]
MKVYRISKCNYIDDLTGKGSAGYPGRWHSKGTYILYTAATSSLALLESVVHLSALTMTDFCIVCLDIPDNNIAILKNDDLPGDWHMYPPPDKCKMLGDNFIVQGKYLALQLPSAVMPEENNFLLNPNHPDFKLVRVVYKRSMPIDQRLSKLAVRPTSGKAASSGQIPKA